MIENANTKKAAIKKSNGCLTAVIIVVVLILGFFGFMIYSMIDFRNKTHIEWNSFDDERIAKVEKYLHMTMPDNVKPVWFRRDSFQDSYTRLIVENISDPQAFLDKAFPDFEITEYTTDDYISQKFKVSSLTDEKINELQKVSPDSNKFSEINDQLDSAIEEKGYSIEFTDIYIRIPPDDFSIGVDYYIGFGKTGSGYSAVITRMKF
jgi:hypothetical protein